MRRLLAAALVYLFVVAPGTARGNDYLKQLNRYLFGRLCDHTHNHGKDRRFLSCALGKPRDLYVYVPPNYDPAKPCNLVVWLHGAFGDEQIAFAMARLEVLDRLIINGAAPPTIVAIPDGTISGSSNPLAAHSFFFNGPHGDFETYLIQDVLTFVTSNYSVRPEREAHAICGVSAGGCGALSAAIRHRNYFAHVATLAPAANLRYDNIEHKYHKDFDPATYRWREDYRPNETIGTFIGGLIRLKEGYFVAPVFGSKKDALNNVKQYNPADLLFTQNLQPGELNIYINYAKNDNFNFDAQIESFQWLGSTRGIEMTLVRDDTARHTVKFFQDTMPALWVWLGQTMPMRVSTTSAVAAKPKQASPPARSEPGLWLPSIPQPASRERLLIR